ncbi:hypothetical protein BJ741DRAFT_662937 [Chytriomyces cf. hyalinus JEL632]|nr:hypothetical protein BJ741DRAFT_662937 [Chytriomyces cf. hyalinus JEL632]
MSTATPVHTPSQCSALKTHHRHSATLAYGRPPTAFQLYRTDRAHLFSQQSNSLVSLQDLNKSAALMWRNETPSVRAEYLARSNKLSATFRSSGSSPAAAAATTERKRLSIQTQQPATSPSFLKPIQCPLIPFALAPSSPLLTLPPTPTGMTPESPVIFKVEGVPSFASIHAAPVYSVGNEQIVAAEALLSMSCQKPLSRINASKNQLSRPMSQSTPCGSYNQLPKLITHPVGETDPSPNRSLQKRTNRKRQQRRDVGKIPSVTSSGDGAYGWLGRVQHERISL